MFDFVRNHNKVIQLLLFVFILPGFFLFGIEGFNRMRGDSDGVAIVDGQSISAQQWEAAKNQDIARYREQAPKIDAKVFDSPEFRLRSLERLVFEKTLQTAVQKFHLNISDQQLAENLLQSPLLAALRDAKGQIDQKRYAEWIALQGQGLTPAAFEERVRRDFSVQQMLQGLSKSAMTPAGIADVSLGAFFEKREVDVLALEPADFAKQVHPDSTALQTFYKNNANLFQVQEKVNIQYVTLDMESVKKTLVVTEEDLKKYYEKNMDRYTSNEERTASHILIEVKKDASASAKNDAKKRAETLLEQAKKAPKDFAALARKNSQDPVSAERGGDLGVISRGSGMVKPFEDAVFALTKPGQISDLIETQFGYHIIQLGSIKTAQTKSFAQMRPELEQQVRAQLAQDKYNDQAEIFTNAVVDEKADSLKAVAEKLKLEIKTADGMTRHPVTSVSGPLTHSKFIAALFSSDVLQKKRNTEAIEVGANTLIAGHVMQYTPAHTQPFGEVKDRIQALYIEQQSVDLARKAGVAKLAELQRQATQKTSNLNANPVTDSQGGLGMNIENRPLLTTTMTISRDAGMAGVSSRNNAAIASNNPKLVDAVMRAKADKLPTWIGVDLGSQGYRLVRVNKVLAGQQLFLEQNRDKYLQVWSSAEGEAFFNYLKNKLKVKINNPANNAVVTAKADTK